MTNVYINTIVKRYGKINALDGVSLTLEGGTMTAVLGPSGCGKTTMLKSLGGFLSLDSGQILFGDTDVTRLPPQDRGAALVFQNYALWPHMSVYENVAYGLKLRKVPKDEIDRRVRNIVELVGLDSDALEKGRKPTQLSGGQQQRVALARALVIEPSLLLLDEPLSNLDAKVRSKLRVYIREIQQKVGITALYVTHDQEEALSIADIIVIMNRGKIMQIGTPQEIYSKPANMFVAEFIGDSTILSGMVTDEGYVRLAGNVIDGIPIQSEDQSRPAPGDEVNIILRAADLKIYPVEQDVSDMKDVLCLNAEVERSMFIGSLYKNIIRFHDQTIFADWETDYAGQKIKLIIPKEKIRLFKEH
jgi:ABC-type Fe3+/spermidine/putrescine transport system ATPase subunit